MKKNEPELRVDEEYEKGAKLYRGFLLMPEMYKNETAHLRVIMRGKFGGWRIKADVVNAFGFEEGKVLYLNHLEVLNVKTDDIEKVNLDVDCIADGDAAKWLIENEVTTGTEFQGVFELRYEPVKGVTGANGEAKIAKLVFLTPDKVITNHRNMLADDKDDGEELIKLLMDRMR